MFKAAFIVYALATGQQVGVLTSNLDLSEDQCNFWLENDSKIEGQNLIEFLKEHHDLDARLEPRCIDG